ncbi:MAG: aspartate racemase [Elusimicrobia bacterium]|nr:MAG: aspartate racemase [Elusimicrobiota bacterium]
MKTIGLIGGMSWESTVPYYETINRTVKERLGGHHSAEILLYSVDFAPIEEMQHEGDWHGLRDTLVEAVKRLERGGADFIVIATNTMHRVYEGIVERTHLPILHIADCVAERIKLAEMKKVALLGTLFTMEQDFYKGRLEDRHRIRVITPELDDRETIHKIIYDELTLGTIREESRDALHAVVDRLAEAGAEGAILGCTELPMLAQAKRSGIQLFDTGVIHAQKAAAIALGDADV